MKTTNYYNTIILVAGDCPVQEAEIPPLRGNKKTAARIQFDMISENPYNFTSDDVIFEVFARKKNISEKNRAVEREKFFSKGQPCLRASALPKRYGWGVYSDEKGRVALFALETEEYKELKINRNIKQLPAMRSRRA